MTHIVKSQVYLRKEELDALRIAAARSGRSIAELIRDAIRKVVLTPQAAGPVAIWDGEPKRNPSHTTAFTTRADAQGKAVSSTAEHHFAVVGFRLVAQFVNSTPDGL